MIAWLLQPAVGLRSAVPAGWSAVIGPVLAVVICAVSFAALPQPSLACTSGLGVGPAPAHTKAAFML